MESPGASQRHRKRSVHASRSPAHRRWTSSARRFTDSLRPTGPSWIRERASRLPPASSNVGTSLNVLAPAALLAASDALQAWVDPQLARRGLASRAADPPQTPERKHRPRHLRPRARDAGRLGHHRPQVLPGKHREATSRAQTHAPPTRRLRRRHPCRNQPTHPQLLDPPSRIRSHHSCKS